MISKQKITSSIAVLIGIGGLVAFLAPLPTRASGQAIAPLIDFVDVEGVIDPVTSRFLDKRIEAAESEGAIVVIRLDTPGGLDVSMRQMTQKILNSSVPIIVWVSPPGARAASAGVFLAYASHIAVMAPGTNIGAAHPVDLGGGRDEVAGKKATNDAAAYLRSIAKKRGRSVEWADEAVKNSVSLDAAEALERGAIDVVAATTPELVSHIRGREVDVKGGAVTIPDQEFTLRFHKMGLLDRLLHGAVRPEIAYLLLLIGFYGLIFEMYNPGIGAAGVMGGVALIFGFYGLSVLPTSWAGLALLFLGITFFIADLHIAGLGIFTAGGVVAMLVGSIMLFSGGQIRLSWWAIGGAVTATMLFFVSVMTAAIRARTAKPLSGSEGIVGTKGIARTDIAPDGQVMARGTLWRARTLGAAIAQGTTVEIKGTSGLMLMVEPAELQATEIADDAGGKGGRGE